MRRRTLLAVGPAALAAGCTREPALPAARWLGAAHERGHRLQAAPAAAGEPQLRRVGVIVVGAGIAGLGAARALSRAGIDDVHVLELEDGAGGNSRGHAMDAIACPLGAHYLPLPGPHAHEVAALLDDLGLRRLVAGRPVYDERHLCHSPQERLFIDGSWVEGLLPPVEALPAAERTKTLEQYRRFAALVERHGAGDAFRVPTVRAPWTPELAALDAQSFAAWLDAQGLDAPALRWLLDYSCRDDFGAGSSMVSAWAGLHYFASRHGFHAPGEEAPPEPVLTWPEGNAWLARRLADPLGDRIHTARVVQRIEAARDEVRVDAWNAIEQRDERWIARQAVCALPLFVASRIFRDGAPAALRDAAAAMHWAPWLVANLRIDGVLADRGGAAPAWDNVAYGRTALGYVDAMHQSLRPNPGSTVLTAYHALGGDSAAALAAHRRRLLDADAATIAREVVDELRVMHADLPWHLRGIELMRYGHAMSIPGPGVRGHAALQALAMRQERVHFAHSDLSGYSVFEEALTHGERAAADVLARFRARR
jgi:monoamine oxidase